MNIFEGVDFFSVNGIFQLVGNLIALLFFIAGSLSVIFIIIGGIRYATSGGNPQQVAAAKKTITYALGGLLLSVLAVLIRNLASGSLLNTGGLFK